MLYDSFECLEKRIYPPICYSPKFNQIKNKNKIERVKREKGRNKKLGLYILPRPKTQTGIKPKTALVWILVMLFFSIGFCCRGLWTRSGLNKKLDVKYTVITGLKLKK